MRESRSAVFGVAAYGIWGLFPLYWPLLEPAGAIEILAHRVVWSLAVVLLLVLALRQVGALRRRLADGRAVALLTLAGALIGVNWGTYIYGVNSGHVVETSLGYYVNPLFTVLLGVFVLRERLRPLQWSAIGLGAAAVAVLSVQHGRPPWIALILAGTFGCYGLVKKQVGAAPLESLTIETAALTPLAVAYLLWPSTHASFAGHGAGHAALLASAGIVTAVPLLAFAAAANGVSLTVLGMLQYLTPTIQLVIGVFVDHEPMPALRLGGFAIVWLALVVFTVDALRHRRRTAGAAAASAASTIPVSGAELQASPDYSPAGKA